MGARANRDAHQVLVLGSQTRVMYIDVTIVRQDCLSTRLILFFFFEGFLLLFLKKMVCRSKNGLSGYRSRGLDLRMVFRALIKSQAFKKLCSVAAQPRCWRMPRAAFSTQIHNMFTSKVQGEGENRRLVFFEVGKEDTQISPWHDIPLKQAVRTGLAVSLCNFRMYLTVRTKTDPTRPFSLSWRI